MSSSLPTTFWGWVPFIFNEYMPMFFKGAAITFYLSFVGTLIGLLIGLIVGIIHTIPVEEKDNPFKKITLTIIKKLLTVYIEFFRGTPMMVQAMIVYYGLMQVFQIDLSSMAAGLLIVSINTGAYMSETVRGGIISIENGQTEAAKALGMTHFRTMYSIVLPQAFRNIIPQIGNNLITNIKDTSVLSAIAVPELFLIGKAAATTYFRYFEVYFIICIIYLLMTLTVSKLLKMLENKLDGPSSYELVVDFEENIPVVS
ncbi:MAG: amino acid ABC transporter permease [Sedimentibacter sp.]